MSGSGGGDAKLFARVRKAFSLSSACQNRIASPLKPGSEQDSSGFGQPIFSFLLYVVELLLKYRVI